MSKIGRNSPCPCGSGKKYKKCCLGRDEEKQQLENNPDSLFEEVPEEEVPEEDEWTDDWEDDWEDHGEDDDEEEVGDAEEKTAHSPQQTVNLKKVDKSTPEINDDQQQIVDQWWAQLEDYDDPEAQIKHLESFMNQHPALLENLEPVEMLLDLEPALSKQGKVEIYIAALERLNLEFPKVYLKEFAYLDPTMIQYLVTQQRFDEVPAYLERFKEYGASEVDMLFPLLEFLRANDCTDWVADVTHATYDAVTHSSEIFNGDSILEPLLMTYYAPYLDKAYAAADLRELSHTLGQLNIDFKDGFLEPEGLEQYFQDILEPLDAAFFNTFASEDNIYVYYARVEQNFMGYLHREKGIGWIKAEYYQELVQRYINTITPDGKRPKHPFIFTKTLTEQTISKTCKDLFSLDVTRSLSMFSALYWFAEYLAQYNAIREDECADIQSWLREWRDQLWPGFLKSDIAATAFQDFP